MSDKEEFTVVKKMVEKDKQYICCNRKNVGTEIEKLQTLGCTSIALYFVGHELHMQLKLTADQVAIQVDEGLRLNLDCPDLMRVFAASKIVPRT
jgi:hypothetical protein